MSSEPTTNPASKSCNSAACRCDRHLSRRTFLKLSTAGTIAAAGMPVMAGPFDADDTNDYLKLIAADKKLDPAWVRSLYARGEKDIYSAPEALDHIGMPVGGLFAGTLYLGGDGRLWLWDIFNRDQEGIAPRSVEYRGASVNTRSGANFLEPIMPHSPLEQGFAVRVGGVTRRLDQTGFESVTFDGRWPIGRVAYRDEFCPLTVKLEAFSPFIPLDAADSSLPATVLSYTLRNESDQPLECEIRGWMENAICLNHRQVTSGSYVNRIVRQGGVTRLDCSATPVKKPETVSRPDILFADFETERYQGWTAEGESFGDGPIEISKIPDYQGDVGGRGKRVVNSHSSAPGDDVAQKDNQVGTLTSEPFIVQRDYINFLLGGGAQPQKTCMNLMLGDRVIASAHGRNHNHMLPGVFNTSELIGQTVRLQIVDAVAGGWGNVGVDHIVFSDQPASGTPELEELPDFGTMTLALLADCDAVIADARTGAEPGVETDAELEATRNSAGPLIGGVGKKLSIDPGQSETVVFIVAWHFPNFLARGVGGAKVGHSYAARFDDSAAVVDYVAENFDRLASTTRLWVDTWYDSTLPYWLLDRTMSATSTLATTTCYRFQDGRFWAWEGIGCCEGTCTHVWHYAQAPGRLFPEIERNQREYVDFGVALHADGGVGMRARLDSANHAAHDGQCGRILGVLREHQMSADDAFLRRVWPRVKRAIEYLIALDADDDGMIEGAQPNTLDAAWYGKISFLASLYLAALRAGQTMAEEMDDGPFAARLGTIADHGAETILQTYDGEYFTQVVPEEHAASIGAGVGCYIDQIFGQTWAHWVGLGRLFDRDKQLSALQSLWRYNFVPDVGPFREHFKLGRWYATAGDAGLLMCTWPTGGQSSNARTHWQYMYFNECMTGFEWQAASNMVWEGLDRPEMLEHGLAVSRAIHDRYNAALRNPYNEVECSDHYARAMAGYGVFLAACGYEYHGPKGRLAFSPRWNTDDFHAAFTAAQGWGQISQRRTEGRQEQRVEVRYGRLRLREIAFDVAPGETAENTRVELNGRVLAHESTLDGARMTVRFGEDVTLETDEEILVVV